MFRPGVRLQGSGYRLFPGGAHKALPHGRDVRDVRVLSSQPGLKFLDDKVAALETLADQLDK